VGAARVGDRARRLGALFALYAKRRTGAIAAGELLSLPLFALLLAAWPGRLTLEAAGAAWLAAYAAYAAFNFHAAMAERATRCSKTETSAAAPKCNATVKTGI
jgi:hypothetical protein